MAELICDTSALIALYQVGLLHILPEFSSAVIVPAAVEQELATGRLEGYDLLDVASFDWMTIRSPTVCDAKQRGLIPAVAPLLNDLDRHEFSMSPCIRESILKAAGETP